MDPIAVLKTLWNYKILVIPIILMTIVAGVYVFKFGPRSYEVNMSYAIVNPSIPTARQLELDPSLDKLNKDNPYLRSSDPSLITDVTVTLLNSSATADELNAAGLGADYKVGQGVDSNGFVVDITGIGDTPGNALSSTMLLSEILERNLHKIQKVNDADDSFLYTALVVAPPDKPVEQFSSRLRSLIAVAIGGGVLLLGAVSVGRSFSESRKNRKSRKTSRSSRKNKRKVSSDELATRMPENADRVARRRGMTARESRDVDDTPNDLLALSETGLDSASHDASLSSSMDSLPVSAHRS